MATIGNLIVNVTTNLQPLQKGLKQAANLASGAILGLGTAAAGSALAVAAASVDIATQVRQANNDIQASLGVTSEKAEELGKIAIEAYKNNFGGSVEETTEVLIEARMQLGELADNEMQRVIESAIALSDVYGVDVSESLNSVKVLTEEFGLTQEQAFDMITGGFQRGLDSSGDYLDTISEYGNLFAENGISAGEMFSILESGLAGGVLGTDKIADLFKGLGIQMRESGEFSGNLGNDFMRVREELLAMPDDGSRALRMFELFGATWEDLGESAVLSVDLQKTSLEDLGGSTDALMEKYDNFSAVWETIKRNSLLALLPLGEALLTIADDNMPMVLEAAGKLEEFLVAAQPIFKDFGEELTNTVGPALLIIGESILRIGEAMGIVDEDSSGLDASLALLSGTLDLIVTAFEAVAVFAHLASTAIETVKQKVMDLTSGDLMSRLEVVGNIVNPIGALSELAIGQTAQAAGVAIPGFTPDAAGRGASDPALTGAIQNLNSALSSGGGEQKIILQIDSETVARVVTARLGRQAQGRYDLGGAVNN